MNKKYLLGPVLGLLAAISVGVIAQVSGGGVEGGGGQPSGNPYATQYKNGNRFGGTGPGAAGTVLTSNGAGLAPTFQASGGVPAGSNTQVQFNNSGAFGASSSFTWSSPTLTVTTPAGLAPGVKVTGNAAGAPVYEWNDLAVAANGRRWWALASGAFQIYTVDDAGTPGQFGFQISRSGNTVTQSMLAAGDGSKNIGVLSAGGILVNNSQGTSGNSLISAGAGSPAAWGTVNLASSNAVTGDLPFANLAQGSALSVLGVAGNSTADVASIAAASDGNVLRRSGTSVGFGAIDLASANAVSGIVGAANGGTGNGFTAFSGPATSTKTFTLPNASATILTSNAAVTLAQGGTGLTTAADDTTIVSSGSAWVATAIPNCGSSTQALAYSTSTNSFSCQTISTGTATSGITSPSCTANTNVDTCSVSSNTFYYMQIGTIVTGAFTVQIDPTSTGTTRVRVAPPVASAFVNSTDAAGSCTTDTSTQTSQAILTANGTNDDIFITFTAAVTSNLLWTCSYGYKVL